MGARSSHRGFTLIEVLIVVFILGVLAAIVIPRFTDASDVTQNSAVRAQLKTLRTQIEYYRNREGFYPDSLEALFEEGFLQDIPDHPGEGAFTYDANTGVITSDVDEEWWATAAHHGVSLHLGETI